MHGYFTEKKLFFIPCVIVPLKLLVVCLNMHIQEVVLIKITLNNYQMFGNSFSN